jgi:prepilin-type N-terminal cleavage/methylation domain-containing protein
MSTSKSIVKLKGFTLLELLIGLVVAGIVLSAIWSAYLIIMKRAALQQQAILKSEDVSLFSSRMMKDFYEADTLFLKGENVLVLSKQDSTVEYRIEAEYTLRSRNNHTDTFHVEARDVAIKNNSLKLDLQFNERLQTLSWSKPASSAHRFEIND